MERISLMEWMQQLDLEFCNQSSTQSDLKEGWVLLELMNLIYYDGMDQEIQQRLKQYQDCFDEQLSIDNYQLIFDRLELIYGETVKSMLDQIRQPDIIIGSLESQYQILDFLRREYINKQEQQSKMKNNMAVNSSGKPPLPKKKQVESIDQKREKQVEEKGIKNMEIQIIKRSVNTHSEQSFDRTEGIQKQNGNDSQLKIQRDIQKQIDDRILYEQSYVDSSRQQQQQSNSKSQYQKETVGNNNQKKSNSNQFQQQVTNRLDNNQRQNRSDNQYNKLDNQQNRFNNQNNKYDSQQHRSDSRQVKEKNVQQNKTKILCYSDKKRLKEELDQLDQLIEKEKQENVERNRSRDRKSVQQNQRRHSTSQPRSRSKQKQIEEQKTQLKEVKSTRKQEIVKWLNEWGLSKHSSTDQLYQNSKKQIWQLLINIVNHKTKEPVIKGYYQKPMSVSQINMNYKKIFEYLKQQEKFNQNYILVYQYYQCNSQNLFWSMMNDLYNFYNRKVREVQSQKREDESKIDRDFLLRMQSESSIHSDDDQQSQKQQQSQQQNYSFLQQQSFVQQQVFQQQQTFVHQTDDLMNAPNCSLLMDLDYNLMKWFVSLGYSWSIFYSNQFLLNDPVRNGTLFCDVVYKLDSDQFGVFNRTPKTLQQCSQNLRLFLSYLQSKQIDIGNMNEVVNQILKGQVSKNQEFIYRLQDYHMKVNKQEIKQIENKDHKILKFINSLLDQQWIYLEHNVSSRISKEYINMQRVVDDISKGILLSVLVNIVFQQNIKINHLNPNSHQNKLTNIRKCLSNLRNQDLFSHHSMWKEKLIAGQDHKVVKELLNHIRKVQKRNYMEFSKKQIQSQFNSQPISLIGYIQSGNIDYSQIITNHHDQTNNQNKQQQDIDDTPIRNWLIDNGFEYVIATIDQQRENDFKDGLILIDLVETIFRVDINGINRKPKTVGACINNIQRLFNFLGQEKQFDRNLIRDLEQMHNPTRLYLLAVLQQIKQIQKTRTACNLKKDKSYFNKLKQKYVLDNRQYSQMIIPPLRSKQ